MSPEQKAWLIKLLDNIKHATLKYSDKHEKFGGKKDSHEEFAAACSRKQAVLFLMQGENDQIFGAYT